MHLYETHVPVTNTEDSKGFYVSVVGLEFAHRDLTRDIIFLWAGSGRRSMLGLWGPSTAYGRDPHKCHSLSRCPCRSCWRAPSEQGGDVSKLSRRKDCRTVGNRLDAIGANLLFRPRRTLSGVHRSPRRRTRCEIYWAAFGLAQTGLTRQCREPLAAPPLRFR